MKFELKKCAWSQNDPPEVDVELTYDESGTVAKMTSHSFPKRATVTQNQGRVWEDDCLEFFYEKDDGYVNLEANSLGALRQSFGKERNGRELIRYASVEIEMTDDGWRAIFKTPDIAQKGNFYACADLADKPYYASWSEIKTPEADFHRPEFFEKFN